MIVACLAHAVLRNFLDLVDILAQRAFTQGRVVVLLPEARLPLDVTGLR